MPALEAEAARYALLRRLAPSMRHHLVVNLQPIGMIFEVMDRRLRSAAPDLAQVQDGAGKINAFARAALGSCNDVIGWVSPDDKAATGVPECVRECAALLATSLGFRGFALRTEIEAPDRPVRRAALRTLLTSAILHASDHGRPPADLVVSGAADAEGMLLRVGLRAGRAGSHFAAELNYRPLEWRDLEALAQAEGVPLAREGQVTAMRFAWVG